MFFLENLILFSPLFVLGLLILVVLGHADALRCGAGLRLPPVVVPVTTADGDNGEGKEVSQGDMKEGEEEEGEGKAEEEGDQGGEEEVEAEEEVGAEEEIEVGEEDYEIIPYGSSSGDDDNPAGTAGPSGRAGNPPNQPQAPPQPPPSRVHPKTRNIGPKKAASLARRDQRRAYNEFQRSQALSTAEATRNLEESLAESVFAEKRRRAVVEEEIAERREKERLDRLAREKEEDRRRNNDMCRLRDIIVLGLSTGRRVWRLSELTECVPGRAEAWVMDALEREGLLGVLHEREGEVLEPEGVYGNTCVKRWQMGMVTGRGYFVVVGMGDIQRLFSALDHSGERGMSWGQMGRELQDILGLES